MSTAVVTFERVGRRRDVPDLAVTDADDLAAVARQVYTYVDRFLGSTEFIVTVSEDGDVLIDGGRFGRGAVVAEVAP